MIPIVLALALALSSRTDSVTTADSVPAVDSAALFASDSEQQAKLEAVQRAWDGDSVSRKTNISGKRSVGSTLAQIVASLALLLGLSGFGFFLLRKVRRRPNTGRSGSLVDVLETHSLGHGNQISLVRVHDRVLTVGHGPGGVSALAEFQGTDAAGILAETGDGAVSVKDFTATLDSFLDRFRSTPAEGGSGEPHP